MSYDVFIIRSEEWADSRSNPILESEWIDLFSNDPEFIQDEACSKNDALMVTIVPGEDGEEASVPDYFGWYNGKIYVSKPTKRALIKMASIARRLNARVVGEYNEVYDENGMPDRPTHFVPRAFSV